MFKLDHIVLAATTLNEGATYVESALGVEMSPGGKHDFMATHNCILKLGEGMYLEVIAIDPEVPPPNRKRWFDLDNPALQKSLSEGPRIVHWVVRTRDIEQSAGALTGPVIAANRGQLHWKITVPDDGSLPFAGAFPSLIEWPAGPHITSRMSESGCAFQKLTVNHPDCGQIADRLSTKLADPRLSLQTAATVRFELEISTAQGIKLLK
jgi:Glyoxalase-like domain